MRRIGRGLRIECGTGSGPYESKNLVQPRALAHEEGKVVWQHILQPCRWRAESRGWGIEQGRRLKIDGKVKGIARMFEQQQRVKHRRADRYRCVDLERQLIWRL